jgi:hypothetical protein
MEDDMAEFTAPTITRIVGQIGDLESLRADSEQQQQQQQQQQGTSSIRRYLNLETNLPEEEVVQRLTTEIKAVNKLAPRAK